MRLADKVAIVTGASRGIGKAIALGFAREGAKVVAAARTESEGRLPGTIYQTAEQIQALGGKALAVKCDVTNDEDVENMARRALAEFGRIDILVNNAGINYRSPILDLPVRRWDLVLRVNLRGTFICTKAVLPTMVKQRSGNIISISSPASRREGPPGEITYGLSKAAMEWLSVGLAEELREHNIAVNVLMPRGPVLTEGMLVVFAEADKSAWKPPDDMVQAAIFIATQDAGSFTGKVVTDAEVGRGWISARMGRKGL